MEMVTKTASDPSTGEKYQIEMPAPEKVKNAILELEFPPEGIWMRDAVDPLADNFRLTDEQRRAETSSGSGLTVFHYRVVHPAFQGLLRDRKLVQPNGKRTPYCLPPTTPRPPNSDPAPTAETSVPVEETYQGIRKTLEEALLQELRQMDPTLFEQLGVDLISKMGYGTGERVGRVGDKGIDGIVTDDRFGLYKVYIQTKCQQATVGKKTIDKFKDALKLQDARMGIFVTTSRFSNNAREVARASAANPEEGFRIVGIIDGEELARLLLEYNVFHG